MTITESLAMHSYQVSQMTRGLVVTTPNGKVFFVSTSNETLKETEKVTETPSQTEELPTTGDKASHAGLLGLDMLLTMFGLSGKHKGKEKN
ncbi:MULTISPECIES: LPXTG cell wall anchor domain-containing protein [Streptococcus]|nr:LPXTG cell wall anchor domain-containing protein [Streptococcus thermophilus]MCZ0707343.1 LPXTG cell wall anchor domain-containing protein [Streptococcus thermophilus]MDA5412653.1 LPXTG cell wall anchor domain-containing protein [Streptococcus thermophilus]UEC17959.1 LPXTG cell wall anchor domain-containing protein [Streptococcus thermophilus LMD-9]